MSTPRSSFALPHQILSVIRSKVSYYLASLAIVLVLGTVLTVDAATVTVGAGGNLQAAINNAQPGDTIVLQAGANYMGPFTLPDKGASTSWITIRTSAESSLPAPGSRVSAADASLMPKLLAPGSGQAALQTAPGAHHYRLVGIEVRPATATAEVYDLVRFGDGSSAQDTLAEVPHHLVLDRSIVTAYSTQEVRRGVALNSAATEITGCHITEIKSESYDTQAIGGWGGPGPFLIENNHLEAAGENIMLGGARPGIAGLVGADVQILRNLLTKPLRWRPSDPSYAGRRWSVKALLEIKSGKRILIEGNVLENCWGDVNPGYAAVNLTVRGDSGPEATIEDVDFRNNVVRHAAVALNVLGRDTVAPSGQGRRVRIVNNLFDDIDGARWGEAGHFLKISNMAEVVVDHNTIWHSYNVVWAYGDPQPGFVFTNNLVRHNSYGIWGVDVAPGKQTIKTYFPGATIKNNVIVGAPAADYPSDNFYPPRLQESWFADFKTANYRLRDTSGFKKRATDRKDVGCDFEALAAATAGVVRR